MITREWLRRAGMRALKTAAQVAAATIGTAVLMSEVNWLGVASATAVATILSFLMSLKGLPEIEVK